MSRPIDADALKAHYSWLGGNTELTKRDLNDIVDVQPTMDVAPVVRGHWVDTLGNYQVAECSNCENWYEVCSDEKPSKELFNAFCDGYKHCPNCGADMREVQG